VTNIFSLGRGWVDCSGRYKGVVMAQGRRQSNIGWGCLRGRHFTSKGSHTDVQIKIDCY
jgi:hypothetical protein